MRAKRRDGAVGTGSHRKNGKGKGKGKDAGGGSRANLFLIAAALMGVLAVVWWFFIRQPVQPVDPNPTGPNTVAVPEQPGTSAEDDRKRLLRELEEKMRQEGDRPDLTAPVEEPIEPVEIITPERRREMCKAGELPPSSCVGASQTDPDLRDRPPTPTGTATTAADHASAAKTAAAQRNWSMAITGFSKALQMEPRNGTYRWGLAEACYRGGQLERAQGEFQTLLAAGNNRATKYLGLIADQFGDSAGAVDYLRQYDGAYSGDPEVQQKLQELTGG